METALNKSKAVCDGTEAKLKHNYSKNCTANVQPQYQNVHKLNIGYSYAENL